MVNWTSSPAIGFGITTLYFEHQSHRATITQSWEIKESSANSREHLGTVLETGKNDGETSKLSDPWQALGGWHLVGLLRFIDQPEKYCHQSWCSVILEVGIAQLITRCVSLFPWFTNRFFPKPGLNIAFIRCRFYHDSVDYSQINQMFCSVIPGIIELTVHNWVFSDVHLVGLQKIM